MRSQEVEKEAKWLTVVVEDGVEVKTQEVVGVVGATSGEVQEEIITASNSRKRREEGIDCGDS